MRRARRVRLGSAARSGTNENVIWPVIYAREKKKQESLQMFSFTRLGNWITQSNVLFSSSASVAASSLRCARVFFSSLPRKTSYYCKNPSAEFTVGRRHLKSLEYLTERRCVFVERYISIHT